LSFLSEAPGIRPRWRSPRGSPGTLFTLQGASGNVEVERI